jgi:hypothetical protein
MTQPETGHSKLDVIARTISNYNIGKQVLLWVSNSHGYAAKDNNSFVIWVDTFWGYPLIAAYVDNGVDYVSYYPTREMVAELNTRAVSRGFDPMSSRNARRMTGV